MHKYGVKGYDVPKDKSSVDELHLNNKSEAYKSKVRVLRTKMSVKGALNLSGVDTAEVQKQKEAEMKRLKSRRKDLKTVA